MFSQFTQPCCFNHDSFQCEHYFFAIQSFTLRHFLAMQRTHLCTFEIHFIILFATIMTERYSLVFDASIQFQSGSFWFLVSSFTGSFPQEGQFLLQLCSWLCFGLVEQSRWHSWHQNRNGSYASWAVWLAPVASIYFLMSLGLSVSLLCLSSCFDIWFDLAHIQCCLHALSFLAAIKSLSSHLRFCVNPDYE